MGIIYCGLNLSIFAIDIRVDKYGYYDIMILVWERSIDYLYRVKAIF